jgi:hypothetical protein
MKAGPAAHTVGSVVTGGNTGTYEIFENDPGQVSFVCYV